MKNVRHPANIPAFEQGMSHAFALRKGRVVTPVRFADMVDALDYRSGMAVILTQRVTTLRAH